jgi:hypothetical protein
VIVRRWYDALRVVPLVLAIGLVAPVRAAADDEPSAQAFYSSAVDAMKALPQPQYLTYSMEGESDGFAVDLIVINHLVWLRIRAGNAPSTWQLRHRTDDYASEIIDQEGTRYVTQRSFFDPTWYGAYRALRDGMLDYQKIEKPLSELVTPAPSPTSTPDLRTIAVVSVMGTSIYRVTDAGAATCSNGDAGHALHLVSRDRNPKHQLSDVVVDVASMRFCMIRFSVSDAFGFHGVVEQHYADVGGFWLQTDGLLDGTDRVFGIATHHGIWRYRLTNVTFPKSIPAEAFVVPRFQ